MHYQFVLPNDAGVIGVFDDYTLSCDYPGINYDQSDCCDIVPLPPGKYKVDIEIADTYRGDKELHVVVEVLDGSRGLVFGDPCYVFNYNEWLDLLKATHDLDDLDYSCTDGYTDVSDTVCPLAIIPTGGDGVWDVDVTITKYEED